jgi:hypothetical protein
VPHDRPRVVPHLPAGLFEPAEQVDVLPDSERAVEPADVLESLATTDDSRRRHVGDSPVGTDDAGRRPEIERRARRLVCSELADRRCPHARGDGGDGGVVEVADEAVEPAGLREDVGIDVSDEWGEGERTGGVSGCGGTAGAGSSHEDRACGLGGALQGCRAEGPRPVVDHDDLTDETPTQLRQQPRGGALVVAHRHDDGELVRRGLARGWQ